MVSGDVPKREFAVIRASAREHEPDRYLAALLAPKAARDDLIVLAAFVGEIHRIGRIVREPHLAEIRLQWWREALSSVSADQTGNPVADAFRAMVARRHFPAGKLDAWFDAIAETLSGEAPAGLDWLAANLKVIEGVPLLFARTICGDMGADDAALDDAALAYGAARLGLDIPYALARGRLPLPVSDLQTENGNGADYSKAIRVLNEMTRSPLVRLRKRFSGLSRAQKCAILPVALVEPYFSALERPDHDSAHDIAEVAPLTRIWRLLRAHVTNRI